MPSENGSARFLASLTDTPSLWRSVDVRTIATRSGGRWCNLVTRCRLDARPPQEISRFPYPLQAVSVVALQRVIPMEELPALLGEVEAGDVQLGDLSVSFRSGETEGASREARPYGPGRTHFAPRADAFRRNADRAWSELTLWATGDGIQQYFREHATGGETLDHELRTLPHPFDGLQGLAQVFLRDSERVGMDHATSFGVVAPFEARLDGAASRLRESLVIRVVAGSEPIRDLCDLAYTAVAQDGTPLADTIPLPSPAWERRGSAWVCDVTVAAPPASNVVILLRVGRYCIDRLPLSNTAPIGQNVAVDAYRVLDPDLEILQEGLETGGKAKAKGFEAAIARLLTLCGFRVDLITADQRMSDAADCVAFADEERAVLVVDCTLGAIDPGGKLGKLHGRARRISGALPGHTVLAVVASQAPLEDLAEQELLRAATDRIVVLTRADYSELLELALSNRPVSQSLALIRSRVPPREVPSRLHPFRR